MTGTAALPIDPDAIRTGDRRALAKAITLIESNRRDDQAMAQSLLATLLPDTGRALRVGLSGAPGVGKSTFIESFGSYLLDQGMRVAVLAVDPSSQRSGGSILGDKTRMERLALDPRAFIRPSPSGLNPGGVARRTREASLVVEAAGFDVVLIETVGVGQGETAVAEMVDMFLLLVSPGGGDELQGIKRGIMELADLVVVTKADGDLEAAARRAQGEYRAALHLMRPKYPGWTPRVLLTSAVSGHGLDNVRDQIDRFYQALRGNGSLDRLRHDQRRAWMWREVEDGLHRHFRRDSQVAALLPGLERDVVEGRITPTAAAERLLSAFERKG